MLLTIDIGNTNISMGVFEGTKSKATWRFATDPNRLVDEYGLLVRNLLPLKGVPIDSITGSSICSVVPPLTSAFEELCRTYFNVQPLTVGTGVKTGVRILYDNPRDVGSDRIVDAAAAYHLYGGPLIIVDFGTATVFDAVSSQGEYIGGAIAPGIKVALEALFLNTSQLRRVELITPKTVIGKNTAHAMQSGLVFGYAGLVESMVHRFKDELGHEAKVIATGGLAHLMSKEAPVFDEVNEDLTLIGLRIIHDLNSCS